MTREPVDVDRQRRELLDALADYVPFDHDERTMHARLRAFVREHPDCFERTNRTGHITASAWIVDSLRSSVILLHHRKLDRWLQPGGHADGDGDLRRVAHREATEETGLSDLVPAREAIFDVDVHAIPARRDEPAHVHYDVRFAFVGDARCAPVSSDESHAVRWISLAEIERYQIDSSIRRLVTKTNVTS